MRNHQKTVLCIKQWEQQVQHEIAATAQQSLQTRFLAYGEELERVEVFKYLGWLLANDNNDTQAIQANLAKACKAWARVSRVLKAENASPKVCGVFYKSNNSGSATIW